MKLGGYLKKNQCSGIIQWDKQFFFGIKFDSMKSKVKVLEFSTYKVVHDVSVGIIFPDPCYQQDHILEGGLF